MKFETLEDKCLYYRGLNDNRLMACSNVIIMLDGRSFSKKVKNKFERPFSKTFMNMMNETARYLCQNISNARLAFVQSDEISILVKDENGDPFFSNRLCKILSICASMASAKFNLLANIEYLKEHDTLDEDTPMYEFDCKAWNVPNDNDAFAWFLYRQNDCVRNSKQQLVQTYINGHDLIGLKTNEQVELLKKEKGIDWNSCTDEEKRGRIIHKVKIIRHNIDTDTLAFKKDWVVSPAPKFNGLDGRENFERFNFKEEE